MTNILDKAIKYLFYSLVFLGPIFFLPLTISPLAINKQMLVSVFVFLLLILWLAKIIHSGKIALNFGKLNAAIILLLTVLGISTLLSSSKTQAFWGMAQESDTFFSFILYGLVFFLFANLFEQARAVLSAFLAGSGVLVILFFLQHFFKIFPWDFAQTSGFNPVGSVQALSVFLGGAFVILMALMTADKLPITADTDKESAGISYKSVAISKKGALKRLTSILPIGLGILLFVAILLINFWVSWLLVLFGATIILWTKLARPNFATQNLGGKSQPKISLLLLILVVAFLFIFLKPPVNTILNLPAELSPNYKATFDIGQKTLQESPKNFLFGSGPATFGYQFSFHRSAALNLTDFWAVRFSQGVAALPTFLTTNGILGLLAFLLLLAIFFYQGITAEKNADINAERTLKQSALNQFTPTPKFGVGAGRRNISGTQLATFIGGVYFLLVWFFYPANFSSMFAAFLMLGLFSASNPRLYQSQISDLSPQKSLTVMIVLVLLIVGAVACLYTVSQKYVAALYYTQAVKLIKASPPDLNQGIIILNKATRYDPKDTYFRDLSQTFLLKIKEVLNEQEMSPEQRQAALQRSITNAETSAKLATQINPKNFLNWFQLGLVYENVMTLVSGVDQFALANYQKAAELDPQNPQIPFNIARVYFRTEQPDKAKEQLQKSLQLKSNFQPAIDLLNSLMTTD